MSDEPLSDENRRIDLGAEVVAFLQGPVGIFLVHRAEEEEREALEELARIEPTDAKGIRELQNQVYRANSVVGWLQEAIGDAVAAHKSVDEQETLAPSSVGG